MKTYINGVEAAAPDVGKWNYVERTGMVALRGTRQRSRKAGRQDRRYYARRIGSGFAYQCDADIKASDIQVTLEGVKYAGRTKLDPATPLNLCDVYFQYADESRL